MVQAIRDYKYEMERNALIRYAVGEANRRFGKRPPVRAVDVWYREWSLCFHGAMEKLVRERGLLGPGNTT